jgi:hypothetical protein
MATEWEFESGGKGTAALKVVQRATISLSLSMANT